MIQGAQLIGGAWRGVKPGFAAVNPRSGQIIAPEFGEAGAEEVSAAMAAATEAFDYLRAARADWAAGLLERIAEEIGKFGEELIDRAHEETALPKARLVSERGRTVSQLLMFARVVREGDWVEATIETAEASRQPAPKPDIRRMRAARGPVVVFGASNFPFAFGAVGGDTASALAAGNPVVVKGHPSHPGTNELFAGAVLAAINALGLPVGLFSLLQGTSHDLGARLVEHSQTAAVGFTGSRKAGRALFDLAAKRPSPIPVFAEMGSVNPLIILHGAMNARGETIAKDLANSVLLGGGQFCTKPGIILVPSKSDKFVTALTGHISVGAPVVMLNRSLRDSFVERTNRWGKIPGVVVRAESKPLEYATVTPSLFETTADVLLREHELREEAFGPVGLIVRYDDGGQILQILEALGGNLTGTIHADASDDARSLIASLQGLVGRVILNGYPTGVEVCSAMVHGGPYPATTDAGTTSVGSAAIARFSRMVAYQNVPDELLPAALQNANPLKIPRMVNGRRTADPIPAA
jgi:alpha-ketoglutaric semialdehyde dehydrogenase